MKKLIEALHVIQEECKKHENCKSCPFCTETCGFEGIPLDWEIDKLQKALL